MAKESMKRSNDLWKWIVLGLVAMFAFLICNPPFDVKNDHGEVVEAGKLRFGLDLKGGTSFTLGVDRQRLSEMIVENDPSLTNAAPEVSEKAVSLAVEKTLQNCDNSIVGIIRRRVDSMGMNEPVIQSMADHRFLVQLPGANDQVRKGARDALLSAAFLEFRLLAPKNHDYVTDALAKGDCPPGYARSGSGFIRFEDPADPKNPKNYSVVSKQPGYFTRLANWHAPVGNRFCFMPMENDDGTLSPCYVYRQAPLKETVDGKPVQRPITGDLLEKAYVERDPTTGKIAIGFRFNQEGARRFSKVTGKHIGEQLAIILDGVVISAPVINSEIGASGQITGHFNIKEAQKLASDLNAGALPAPLEILSETEVAPTVGTDAINAGLVAAGLGFGLVALFMFFYYWRSGLVADVALFLDIALLPTALVFVANVLGVFAKDISMGGGGTLDLPVLTMPGIAGMVLSLGMAVDANVLIFERIREEFIAGRNAGDAIRNGYGRAFTAIFDSNLTTIITGIILFVVGTGPVRGFAITLTAGVVISMFTAVVVTRIIFNRCVKPSRTKPFRMMQVFKNPSFDFLGKAKLWVGGSFAIIALSIAIFAVRLVNNKADVLSVDLTGGTSIVFRFNENAKPAEGEIRKAISDFDNAAVVQFQTGLERTTLLVKTGESTETQKGQQLKSGIDPVKGGPLAGAEGVDGKKAGTTVQEYLTARLQQAFPQAEFSRESADEVGSVVGGDLKSSGTKAVIFSLIAILLYVAFRFQFGFGVGALVALAHDALIAIGLYSLCGRQISLIVITAVLTIIGYSVNDTVVVFDRIRERLQNDKRTSFKEICNESLNACLSRTVITSITTLFAVLALFAFGDGPIFDFALIMFIGVIAGTYSSMFIATPIMLWCYRGKRPDFDDEEA